MARFIDPSFPITDDVISDPGMIRPGFIYMTHESATKYQIEKLINLASLPDFGFMFSCFPVKIERASAGWIRAVAIVGE